MTELLGYRHDADGTVTLTLSEHARCSSPIDADLAVAVTAAIDRLTADKESVTGVILHWRQESFVADGAVNLMASGEDVRTRKIFDLGLQLKTQLRRLETYSRPVVAVLDGTTLGLGLGLTLACHRRIAADVPDAQFGFPEVTVGLLPGAGSIGRSVRMVGIDSALHQLLLSGTPFTAAQALDWGVIDEIVSDAEDLLPQAKSWIRAHPDVCQPWDVSGYRIPGGGPSSPTLAALLPSVPARLRQRIGGANYPAPRAIMAAAVEGAHVDIDTAGIIEARYLTELMTGQVARNMVQAFGVDPQTFTSPSARPGAQDSRRRFYSRLRWAVCEEAIVLVGEGSAAASVEQAALQAGYRKTPLQLADEWGLDLLRTIPRPPGHVATVEGSGGLSRVAADVIEKLIAVGRTGRAGDAGFYDYRSGVKGLLWPQLAATVSTVSEADAVPFADMQERLLFAQALDSVRCLAEGVVTGAFEADAYSLTGDGFPRWTGGVLQYINGYRGGSAGFVARARELAGRYGSRFNPMDSLLELVLNPAAR